jgi:hypothetical protein
MNRTIVREIQGAFRQRFVGTGTGNLGLERVELGLIPQVELVHEDG